MGKIAFINFYGNVFNLTIRVKNYLEIAHQVMITKYGFEFIKVY